MTGGAMIVFDWPLMVLAGLFLLFFGPVYAWGMVRWFGGNSDRSILSFQNGTLTINKPPYRFNWSIAATVGIAFIVSVSYVFSLVSLQGVFNLAIVFLSALPAMIYVDIRLKKTTVVDDLIKQQNVTAEQIRSMQVLFETYQKNCRPNQMEYKRVEN